jgi:hypothetical protein
MGEEHASLASVSEYGILQLPGALIPENREPLGSKEKLWFRDPDDEEPRVLFKFNRPGTGEDWSEKIAAELAQLLGLPHSKVELAMFEEQRGAALVDFTDNGRVALVHGNELLEFVDPDYPTERRYRAVKHTVAAVQNILTRPGVKMPDAPRPLPSGVTDAFGVFIGYLMLDAWIGNTDRHHENWGLLWHADDASRSLVLAPSFDHASSLGRELTDDGRTRAGQASQGTPAERYARRARSAFYPGDGSARALSPWVAFHTAAASRPHTGRAWLNRLDSVPREVVREMVGAVPESLMSSTAKDFACALLEYNAKLLGV